MDDFLTLNSELIRNQTLKFLSKTLPVLKADDTLPKVTQIPQDEVPDVFENDNGYTESIYSLYCSDFRLE